MNRARGGFQAAVFTLAAVTAGCASGPSAPAAGRPAETSARCSGTLGLEVRTLTRQLRKTLALPGGFRSGRRRGVSPGGPAAAAGIARNDIVEESAPSASRTTATSIEAAFNRTCDRCALSSGAPGRPSRWNSSLSSRDPSSEDELPRRGRDRLFPPGPDPLEPQPGERPGPGARPLPDGLPVGLRRGCANEEASVCWRRRIGARMAVSSPERSCDLGSGAGCTHLAFLYATGSGSLVKKDDRRATPLYVKACDLGDALGCYNAGLMSDEGRGVARDISRAAARYDEACEMGSSTGCTNLGFLYENGRGVKKDRARRSGHLPARLRRIDVPALEPHRLRERGPRLPRRDGCREKGRREAAAVVPEGVQPEARARTIHTPTKPRARVLASGSALSRGRRAREKGPDERRELSVQPCFGERGDSFGCFNAAPSSSPTFGASTPISRQAASFSMKPARPATAKAATTSRVAYGRDRRDSRPSRHSPRSCSESLQTRLPDRPAEKKGQ